MGAYTYLLYKCKHDRLNLYAVANSSMIASPRVEPHDILKNAVLLLLPPNSSQEITTIKSIKARLSTKHSITHRTSKL